MRPRIIIAALLLLAIAAGWLAWSLLGTAAGLGSSEIIEAPNGRG